VDDGRRRAVPATGNQRTPTIVSDSAGGAIVAWVDDRGGTSGIYAQRVDARGGPQWTPDGVALCTPSDSQWWPQIVSDGAGGAIVAWEDLRSGPSDIYAQKVNAVGTPQWDADGVALCTVPGVQTNQTLVPDGAGGAIVSCKTNAPAAAMTYTRRR